MNPTSIRLATPSNVIICVDIHPISLAVTIANTRIKRATVMVITPR